MQGLKFNIKWKSRFLNGIQGESKVIEFEIKLESCKLILKIVLTSEH